VFARVLDIALRFAVEGREGKPIGTTFVLGEPSQLEKHTRALILNPFAGHARKARNVHSAELVESLRELASLDGAFIIDGKGVVEQAAVYLDAPLSKQVKVPKGLGARHTAAAAVSSAADAVSIVISESSGIVTVFARGAVVLEIGRN
jgi:DNA integrity scanning protein DisA with diadenylate cyclase activity